MCDTERKDGTVGAWSREEDRRKERRQRGGEGRREDDRSTAWKKAGNMPEGSEQECHVPHAYNNSMLGFVTGFYLAITA